MFLKTVFFSLLWSLNVFWTRKINFSVEPDLLESLFFNKKNIDIKLFAENQLYPLFKLSYWDF